VYEEVELEFQAVEGILVPQEQEVTWPSGMPKARVIQQQTMDKIAEIWAQDQDFAGSPGAGHCVAVVQPPGTGKTFYYRAFQCITHCVAVVIIPFVSLLDEAVQGSRDAGLKTFVARDLLQLTYK
jgi:hypothetical protein